MTIFDFAAERGYCLTLRDKLILCELERVHGTPREETMLDVLWHGGDAYTLWTAYRAYNAMINAEQMKLF